MSGTPEWRHNSDGTGAQRCRFAARGFSGRWSCEGERSVSLKGRSAVVPNRNRPQGLEARYLRKPRQGKSAKWMS